MKKNVIFLFIAILIVSISCNPKKKTGVGNEDNIGPDGDIPDINITVQEKDVNDTLDKVYDYVADTTWASKTPMATIDDIRNGVLITRIGAKYYVLRITSNGDVTVGLETSLANALEKSTNADNYDPRKFVYQLATTVEKATINDNGLTNADGSKIRTIYDRVSIVWSGRVSSGIDLTYYDKYKYALGSSDTTYKAKSTYTRKNYVDLGLNNSVKIKEQSALGSTVPIAGGIAHFFLEGGLNNAGGKRAWAYVSGYMSTNGKGDNQVSYPHFVRYGSSSSADVTASDLYLSGFGGKENIMKTATTINANENLAIDTRGPIGKTVLRRRTYNNSNPADYLFFSTVVGYNVRMKDYTGKPNSFTDDKGIIPDDRIKDVIVEFDETSYKDAQEDGWVSLYDIPRFYKQTAADTEIGGSATSPKTFKVPFIFIK